MALSASPFPKETLSGFLGVSLRRDGLSIADEQCLYAIEADFHTLYGAIKVRQGRTLLNATQLGGGLALRTLARHNTRRYQVAGTVLYRDWSSILTGLAGPNTTLVAARPLNDTTTWSFIADPAVMRKDNGTNVRIWGIVAPAAAPTIAAGAAGSLTGNYRAVYTYARVVGGLVAHESNPSAAPTAVALAAQTLDVTVVASADPQVTNIRIYRTAAGGTSYLFDQQVANANATINSSQADSALGTAVETDNNTPPLVQWVVEWQGHIWFLQDASYPHYLWYSKRFRPESVPTGNFLEIGDPADPLQVAVPMAGQLGVLARQTKYRVTGNGTSGFAVYEALNTRGTPAPQAVIASARGAVFVARDGLWATDFVSQDVEFSQDIAPLFYGETVNGYNPIDWNATTAMTLAEWKRRIYFGYQDTAGARVLAVYSHDTKHWYFYTHPVHRLLAEEDTGLLTMGSSDGYTWSMESGGTDGGSAINLSTQLAVRSGGDRFVRKQWRFISVDADASTGTWSIPLYIDGTLVTTYTLTGTRQKRLYALPVETNGYFWQVRPSYVGPVGATLYSVELVDTGLTDGQVWVAATGGTNTYLTIVPAKQATDPYTLKPMRWLQIDADSDSGTATWTVQLYVDRTLQHTATVQGNRNHHLLKLPARLQGYTWYVVMTYSIADAPNVYGAQLVDQGPQDGQVWVRNSNNAYVGIIPAQGQMDLLTRKQFTCVAVDGEVGTGMWTVALYMDDTLHTSFAAAMNREKRLHRLPTKAYGNTWRVEATYSEVNVPPLYAAHPVDTGEPDGQVWIRATGFTDVFLKILPATQPPDKYVLKRFRYLKLDAEASSGTWTLYLYIDGTHRYTATVTGHRDKSLLRLPDRLMGHTWYIEAAYSEDTVPQLYSVEVQGQPLRGS